MVLLPLSNSSAIFSDHKRKIHSSILSFGAMKVKVFCSFLTTGPCEPFLLRVLLQDSIRVLEHAQRNKKVDLLEQILLSLIGENNL